MHELFLRLTIPTNCALQYIKEIVDQSIFDEDSLKASLQDVEISHIIEMILNGDLEIIKRGLNIT